LYGGASPFIQKKNLKKDPSIIIATPGRLKDLSNRGELNLGIVNNVVLDEVDRLLDMGFIDDIRYIIHH
jgi:superfamily II DNA/RNA helicase